jgi:protein-S-isoprenylcysteine O-methyltransferase Ste14
MKLGTAARDPWVWGQLLLIVLILAGAPWLARTFGVTLTPTRLAVAGITLGVAIAILVRGFADLGPNLTPATRPLDEGALVTRGIYRLVRHPIYLGLSLLLAAWALGAAGWAPGMVVFVVCVLYFEGKARVEERWMRARFPGYDAYARTTPRLLPLGWK